MADKAEFLLDLPVWAALALVFALPALESSAFLGFLFPGEIAVLLGGVLASQHRVPLPAVMAAGVLGAVVGDSVGYAVGRRWGRRILDSTVGRFVKPHHLDRAQDHLRRRGGLAVVIGRFTAALRVMIPGLAGMANMPYRTFAIYNVLGGTVWAVTFVLVGYAAGSEWQRAAHVAGRAGLLAVIGIVVVTTIVLTARWAAANPSSARARVRPIVDARPVRWVAAALRGNVVVPALIAALAALDAGSWLVGSVVSRVLGSGPVDRPVLHFIADHRSAWLDSVNRFVTAFGNVWVVLAFAAALGVAARLRRGSWRGLVALAVSAGGGILLVNLAKHAVGRPRPPASLALVHATGFSFPSGHTVQATVVWGMAAVVLATTASTWTRKVVAWTGVVLVVLGVGASRVYLGAHWLTDVVAGWILGGLWVAAVALVLDPSSRRRVVPDVTRKSSVTA